MLQQYGNRSPIFLELQLPVIFIKRYYTFFKEKKTFQGFFLLQKPLTLIVVINNKLLKIKVIKVFGASMLTALMRLKIQIRVNETKMQLNITLWADLMV